MRLRRSIAITMALGALLAGGGGLTAAAQADTPHSQQPPHLSSIIEHNTELGREFVVMENARDNTRQRQIADDIVSPNYIQHNALVAPGRAGLLAFLQDIHTVMPDVKFTSHDIFATDDRVVSRFTITGTLTGGPFLGIPPSGQKLDWDGIDIWTVRDGKLFEHWDEFDWPTALIQLGVQGLPQPFIQAASPPANR